jgi:hypothetical protein
VRFTKTVRLVFSRSRAALLYLLGLLLDALRVALPVAVSAVVFFAQQGDISWWALAPTVIALFVLLALFNDWASWTAVQKKRSEYLTQREAGALFYNAIPEERRSEVRCGFDDANDAGWAALEQMIVDGLVPLYCRWGEDTAIEKAASPEEWLRPVSAPDAWGNTGPVVRPRELLVQRRDLREAVAIWLRTPG